MRSWKLPLALLGALALLVGIAALTGFAPLHPGGGESTLPPCKNLPSARSVGEAIEQHGDLVRRLERVGPHVRVARATPCGKADRAIVRITYGTVDDRSRIERILEQDGFQAPVQTVRD